MDGLWLGAGNGYKTACYMKKEFFFLCCYFSNAKRGKWDKGPEGPADERSE